MATKPTAAIARLLDANNNAYDETTNPGGLAEGGHRQNFVPDLQASIDVGEWVEEMAGEVETVVSGAGDSAIAASAAAMAAGNARTDVIQLKADTQDLKDAAFGFAEAAESAAAGVNLPAITIADAGKALVVKDDGTGYEPALIDVPTTPPILEIAITSPASGATGVGAGGGTTFVGTPYYSLYGVPQDSRAVNVYDAAGTTLVTTFPASGAGTTVAATLTGVLAVNTPYQAEMVYEDALGNTAVSPKVPFTTATVFKPGVGQAYEGGFLGFENFGDGYLYDLITAAKSTEASKTWDSGSTVTSALSRLNGVTNTAAIVFQFGGATTLAGPYADQLVSGSQTDWHLGAIDALRAIATKLRPSAATQAAFQTGGAEVFENGGHWSSTELTASNAAVVGMGDTLEFSIVKTSPRLVRPIRRIQVPLPAGLSYGQAYEGGYIAAAFTDMSVAAPNTFLLIVADKATEVTRRYDGVGGVAVGGATLSRTNGPSATAAALASRGANAEAFSYCDNLTSGTKTDWYLGAIDEMLAVKRMDALLPSGQQLGSATTFWTSTEVDASNAKAINTGGAEISAVKTATAIVRPIRRVLLPA